MFSRQSVLHCVHYLDKAVVERETVSYRVLPALPVVPVIRKRVGDEQVDVRQRRHA